MHSSVSTHNSPTRKQESYARGSFASSHPTTACAEAPSYLRMFKSEEKNTWTATSLLMRSTTLRWKYVSTRKDQRDLVEGVSHYP